MVHGSGEAGYSSGSETADPGYSSDPGQTDGGGGIPSYGITYSADTWTGWENEITTHSAGLVGYSAPTSSGDPGITYLTDAGKAALGLDISKTYIETYSWGAALGDPKIEPAKAGTYSFLGIDFTPLANMIIAPISEALTPIVNTVNSIMEALGSSIMAGLSDLSAWMVKGITDVMSDINTVGQSVSDAVKKITDPILQEITGRVNDLTTQIGGITDPILQEITGRVNDLTTQIGGITDPILRGIIGKINDLDASLIQFWTQGLKNIDDILTWVHLTNIDVSNLLSGLESEADLVRSGFAGLETGMKTWVPDAIFTALLQALDRSVGE